MSQFFSCVLHFLVLFYSLALPYAHLFRFVLLFLLPSSFVRWFSLFISLHISFHVFTFAFSSLLIFIPCSCPNIYLCLLSYCVSLALFLSVAFLFHLLVLVSFSLSFALFSTISFSNTHFYSDFLFPACSPLHLPSCLSPFLTDRFAHYSSLSQAFTLLHHSSLFRLFPLLIAAFNSLFLFSYFYPTFYCPVLFSLSIFLIIDLYVVFCFFLLLTFSRLILFSCSYSLLIFPRSYFFRVSHFYLSSLILSLFLHFSVLLAPYSHSIILSCSRLFLSLSTSCYRLVPVCCFLVSFTVYFTHFAYYLSPVLDKYYYCFSLISFISLPTSGYITSFLLPGISFSTFSLYSIFPVLLLC